MTSPRLLLWIEGALFAAGCAVLTFAWCGCATCPPHPKQVLDAPMGSCINPEKDYGPACTGEETCIDHDDGRRECFCAYEVPDG